MTTSSSRSTLPNSWLACTRCYDAPAGVADRLTLGDVSIDFKSQSATRAGQALHLTHREFELLRFLAARAGRVVHRGELLRGVWGYPDDSATTRSVDHAIARLRRKIEPQSDQPRFIHTVHGDGYSLTPGTRGGG